ncbi:MAG: GNAT family N-acetyltransferase [Rhodococcus sp. (in: high G+C Gram-positive bacteria)]
MSIVVSTLTLGGFESLPAHDRQCVFWTMDPASPSTENLVDAEFEKEAWLSMVMLEWGPCGQVATGTADAEVPVSADAVGCALYAPPRAVPRATHFPTAPVSPDAVLLTSLYSPLGAENGDDIREALMHAAVRDLINRGVRALEVFGIRLDDDEKDSRYSGIADRPCGDVTCMIDADFLEKYGFEVVANHHRYPRLRLELDRDHGWKEDVEAALERLLEAAALTVVEADARVPVGAR